MPEIKSPGQLAYEGFSQKSGGKSVITSEPLPTWNAQIEAVKQSWEAAAAAVNTAQNVDAPKPAPEPAKKPVERPEPDQFASYRAATQVPTAPKPQPITQTLPKPVERPEPPKGPISQPPLKPKTSF